MEARYLSCAETAKLVRAALAKNFPGVKFSVRSDVYSGGASIDVRWILGPTTKEVDAIAGQYESASFDGMIDMETNYHHWLLPDGSARIQSGPGTEGSMGTIPEIKPQPRPEGAELVSFGAHYVQCQRSITKNYQDEMKFREQVARDMCALQHVEWAGQNTIHLFGEGDTEQVDQHAWRLINETSFKPGEEYAGVRYATEEERHSKNWPVNSCFVILKKGITLAAPEPKHDVEIIHGVTIRENKNLSGIEVIFPTKPPSAILSQLKAAGFRWSHQNSLWYNRMSEENMKFIKDLVSQP